MTHGTEINRNIVLLPWFGFLRNLVFWQATWFLYFQSEIGAAQAILLYIVYDVSTTILEVPSGYFSDRFGRRFTLILSAVTGLLGCGLLASGFGGFGRLVVGQALLGAHSAFVSGTDSALLYESLAAEGRQDEIEHFELRMWRFSFAGLALSAVIGGAMALVAPVFPFAASAVAFCVLIWVSFRFCEPDHSVLGQVSQRMAFAQIGTALRQPLLVWLLCLSVLLYGYSHIPFVFGQPFILEALGDIGFNDKAPLVSGVVTAIMMILSLGTSILAPSLRRSMGLTSVLLLAFGIQIALSIILGLTNAPWAIALLFLRMVPDSLSRPFILASVQPMLRDQSRATFLSLRSFLGRLVFAASLFVAAGSTWSADKLQYAEMQPILLAYGAFGCVALILFAVSARHVLGSKKQRDAPPPR